MSHVYLGKLKQTKKKVLKKYDVTMLRRFVPVDMNTILLKVCATDATKNKVSYTVQDQNKKYLVMSLWPYELFKALIEKKNLMQK